MSYGYVPQQDEMSFQQFDYQQYGYQQQEYQQQDYNYQYDYQQDVPTQVSWESIKRAFSTGGFNNEPPLLEELGINFSHILSKGFTVLNPIKAGCLLLSGKAHFGYIYGIATMGCIVILSGVSILVSLSGTFGLVISGLSVAWCAFSASGMFVSVLDMKEQRLLVAYPVGLLYSAFAMVTVF
ncbi:hypothetical protein HK103_001073 [Boothiomyces macroporosus]|uniref:Protein YIP n=1 Tax=Boothiomyces macroporosus TaxID=261099 RepID=A0AAD5Y587_9FUNG|nr:hypothetical protein HK103_001073 [Boothiomyces macroporosus]